MLLRRCGKPFDHDGECAAAGRVDDAALAVLLDDDYFSAPPPKSLDRNAFDAAPIDALSTEDGAATLVAFSAETVALGLALCPEQARRILVTGGGRHNPSLMGAIRQRSEIKVVPVEALGWRGDALEAEAFAFLAVRALHGAVLSVPETTGVRRAVSGGVLHQSQNGWDNAIATHLTATMLLSKLSATSMSERGSGKIINLASMYSIFGAAALPSYGAAKGGIVQLTKAMAVELAPHGVQVNAIAPGWISTEMTQVAREDPDWADFQTMLLARTPMGRWGEPDECAGAAIFLASDAARFVTGVTLPVDGGYSIF